MAAAQSWEHGFPPEVAALCGPDAELQLALVEHRVQLPGRGSPSHCDVFALVHAGGQDMAVAIEAKVDEPFGPTIAEWLGSDPTPNKTARLNAIAGWLGLALPAPGLRYQLLHRTAAAIFEARRFRRPVAAMIVQSFSPDRRRFGDFAGFCAALGLDAAPDAAMSRALPCGLQLRLGWATGNRRFLMDGTAHA